jgi:GNAT superfamily N-acetyltransferase
MAALGIAPGQLVEGAYVDLLRPPVSVRRLDSHESTLHRDLRLRALRDSPDAFGETFADAAARPASYWDDLTRSVTPPGRQVMLLACEGGQALGSAYGLLDPERPAVGHVGGMWVDPTWRRRGVGRTLLQEIVGWARAQGLSRLSLWAPAHSAAALALYHRAGFRETGARRPLPTDPALEIVEMQSSL